MLPVRADDAHLHTFLHVFERDHATTTAGAAAGTARTRGGGARGRARRGRAIRTDRIGEDREARRDAAGGEIRPAIVHAQCAGTGITPADPRLAVDRVYRVEAVQRLRETRVGRI